MVAGRVTLLLRVTATNRSVLSRTRKYNSHFGVSILQGGPKTEVALFRYLQF